MRHLLLLYLLLALTTLSFAQGNQLSKGQQKSYKVMHALCSYYDGKKYDTLQREVIFKQFVYFDNVLADTSKSQRRRRVKSFDWLFAKTIHFIDSVGANNLDARHTSYFKYDTSYFRPFAKTGFGGLRKLLPYTLTYFDKRAPTKPIGTLFFEPRTHKLVAWIIINQGGHYYPLSFNLL